MKALKKIKTWLMCYLYFVAIFWDAKDRRTPVEKWRDWIKEEGLRTNVCTYNVLREVCGNCQCKRATHPKD